MDNLIAGGLIVGIVVFIVVRAFWLWYWKINEGIALLKEIRTSLHVVESALVVPQPVDERDG